MANDDDMINQLLAQTTVQPQPSFMGLQAPPDPSQLQALLGKVRQQQFLQQQQQATPGEFGFLHDAGRSGMVGAGQQLGNILQQPAPGTPPPQQNGPQAQIAQALQQGKQAYAAMINAGVDPDTATVHTMKLLTNLGVPGADQKLAEAQTALLGNNFKKSETDKDTSQAAMDRDEITNRHFDQSTKTWTTTYKDPKGFYELQTNGQGEVKRVELNPKPTAAEQAGAAMTPDVLQSMLDYYHTNGTIPPGLARNPSGAAKFWQAEAAYNAQTGNYAAAAAANKMQLHSLNVDTANVQKQLGATSSYLATMDKNIEKARALGNSLDFGDVTTLNKALQAWDRGTSDPKYAKYNVFFNSVAVEYAKLSSGNMGNTTVSDSQRHETQQVINSGIGNGGMNGVFDALKEEGQNKVDGYKEHLAQNLAQMQGTGANERAGLPQNTPVTPPAPAAAGGWGTASVVGK